jgi:hypothetical protein
VVASTVILAKGVGADAVTTLNDVVVHGIDTSLSEAARTKGRGDPQVLTQNKRISSQGVDVYGTGFFLSLEEGDRLRDRLKATSRERVRPFIGGEELYETPDFRHQRYAIDLSDVELADARRDHPELLRIVEERVRPQREKLGDNADAQRLRAEWWRYNRDRPNLRTALAPLKRCLVISRHTSFPAFVFKDTSTLFSDGTCVFAWDSYERFGLLQSRIHVAWAMKWGGSLKHDLRYKVKTCFATFPCLGEGQIELEKTARTLYEARARFMERSSQGATSTYNLLRSPEGTFERMDEISQLRELHEELDRAVLRAYGWSDITVPVYCPITDADRAAIARFEDVVIERLFELNTKRAAAEAKATGTVKPTSKPNPAKPKKARAPSAQTSLLDDEGP